MLTAALQSLSVNMDPSRIIYVLQAEVLLAHYLFHKNRRLEGGYHAAAAVSIAVACELHKIRSATWRSGGGAVRLYPPTDAVEEGERVRAFWAVFTLDRCWAVWLQSTSVFLNTPTAATLVDTPWPLEMEAYEEVSHARIILQLCCVFTHVCRAVRAHRALRPCKLSWTVSSRSCQISLSSR